MQRYATNLCWFRCDLRARDHAALHAALTASGRVYCAFVFDTEILDKLPSRRDRRVDFIHASVTDLAGRLEAMGGGLVVLHGPAWAEIPRLAARLDAGAVYANHDYEPLAVARVAAGSRARGAAVWLSELVWRDNYHMILRHFPDAAARAFRPESSSVAIIRRQSSSAPCSAREPLRSTGTRGGRQEAGGGSRDERTRCGVRHWRLTPLASHLTGYLRQNAGVKRTRTVKSSSRPISIANAHTQV